MEGGRAYQSGGSTFSSTREAWEVPIGCALFAPAIALDAVISVAGSALIGLANPINWICMALGEPPRLMLVYALPFTSMTATLINPDCNLDTSRCAAPERHAEKAEL